MLSSKAFELLLTCSRKISFKPTGNCSTDAPGIRRACSTSPSTFRLANIETDRPSWWDVFGSIPPPNGRLQFMLEDDMKPAVPRFQIVERIADDCLAVIDDRDMIGNLLDFAQLM
jgi:hypothetical protein